MTMCITVNIEGFILKFSIQAKLQYYVDIFIMEIISHGKLVESEIREMSDSIIFEIK